MLRLGLAVALLALMFAPAEAQSGSAVTVSQAALIQPAALAEILKGDAPPVIIQVGFSVLYAQAHIPGALYAGPTGKEEGVQSLKDQVRNFAKDKALVIYCGCCPWVRCPNIAGAWRTLTELGFTNVKVLYIEKDFGTDWVDKGYPVVRG
jgi:thiosulfate/3-mercaptopyruvate sulfurtransferase